MKSIYLITDNIYIGSFVNAHRRLNGHKLGLSKNRHPNPHLQRAWNKYGESNFSFEVILFCSRGNSLFFEQRALDIYKPEYNILKIAGSTLGYKHSESSKLSRSSVHKGKIVSEETRIKIKESKIGKHHSEETKKRISDKTRGTLNPNYGKIMSEEQKTKISISNLGKIPPNKGIPMTDEQKIKISITKKGNSPAPNKGVPCSEETKIKIREAKKNISEETRHKISQAKLGKPSWNKGKKLSSEHKENLKQNHKSKKSEIL